MKATLHDPKQQELFKIVEGKKTKYLPWNEESPAPPPYPKKAAHPGPPLSPKRKKKVYWRRRRTNSNVNVESWMLN